MYVFLKSSETWSWNKWRRAQLLPHAFMVDTADRGCKPRPFWGEKVVSCQTWVFKHTPELTDDTYISSTVSSMATSSTTSTPTSRFLLTVGTRRSVAVRILQHWRHMRVRVPMNHLRWRCVDIPASRSPDALAPSAGRRRRIPGPPVLHPPTSTCRRKTGIPMALRHHLRAPLLAGLEAFQASAGGTPLGRSTDRWCPPRLQGMLVIVIVRRSRHLGIRFALKKKKHSWKLLQSVECSLWYVNVLMCKHKWFFYCSQPAGGAGILLIQASCFWITCPSICSPLLLIWPAEFGTRKLLQPVGGLWARRTE